MIDREKILRISLYAFSAILLIVIVFLSTVWILNKFSEPKPEVGEFPVSPITSNFPPPPEFIKIAELYFSGPYSLKNNSTLKTDSLFSILCKQEDDYGIMYIGDTTEGFNLLSNASYSCWFDNCGDGNNLYVATFETPTDKYKAQQISQLKLLLWTISSPPCPITTN